MLHPKEMFKEGDGLLVLDVQNDFCPGGALAIEQGDEIIPELNIWIKAARELEVPIYLSRDWHPKGHPSFFDPWPVHCLQDTKGAMFHPELQVPDEAVVVTKGVRFDQDQISAFDETGLAEKLFRDGVRRLFVGGLALDVCVLATVLDARLQGFEINVLLPACRSISHEDEVKALEKMKKIGANLIEQSARDY